MTEVRDILSAGLLVAGSVTFILMVEGWTRRAQPSAEWSRKVLHIGGLIPCLFVPVAIHSIWVAFVLSLLVAVGLFFNERLGVLKCVSRVQRETSGTAYYPLAVFLVFVLSGGRTWMYISALLALCLADALAAVVGKSFARIRYDVENHWKSLEGSLVFFCVTFGAVLLPLLVMTSIPWPRCLLAAMLTALLVTGFEAISLNGFDNLFVPVGVCIVLDRIVLLPWNELFVNILVLLCLLVAVTLIARLTRQLDFDASLVLVLFTYTAIALADWRWALAPLLGLAIFLAFRMKFPPEEEYRSRVRVLLTVRILLPLLMVLSFAYATGEHTFLQGPYLVCAAVTLCFSLRVFLAWRNVGPPRAHPVISALVGAGIGAVLVLPPWGLQGAPLGALVGIVVICALLTALHEWTLPRDRPKTIHEFWTAPRLLLVCVAILGMMLMQGLKIIPLWPESTILEQRTEA